MDPDEQTRRIAAESLAVDDPTGWFERLYSAASDGEAVVPWDRGAPHRLLVEWAQALEGAGRRALVVGSGLGEDSELVAALGFDTVAFDVSETAIRTTRERFPDSTVRYLTADLLDPPPDWWDAFDLVVESLTVQSLPDPPRAQAIANVARMVAPGGTLLVIAAAREPDEPAPAPPWPLTRAEIDAFASGDLEPVRIEQIDGRWRAELRRPDGH
jgi:SAM-dependent methyltransferase